MDLTILLRMHRALFSFLLSFQVSKNTYIFVGLTFSFLHAWYSTIFRFWVAAVLDQDHASIDEEGVGVCVNRKIHSTIAIQSNEPILGTNM